jgi:hypothetical protein
VNWTICGFELAAETEKATKRELNEKIEIKATAEIKAKFSLI